MFIVFLALWVIFNGRIGVDVLVTGAAVSAALYAFCWKFLSFSPDREWRAVKQAPRMLVFLATLLWEIVKANLRLTRIVLSKKPEIHPVLVTFKTPLKSRVGRAVLADSITLTPGTITVYLKKDELTVHCLGRHLYQGR